MKRILSLLTAVIISLAFAADICALSPQSDKPEISAKAAVLIEAGSGRIIFGKSENQKLPMASTTKIMTTLLTLESGELDTEFTVDSTAVHTEGSSMGLREGDIVSKRDLCIGMLLPSGNDAANCAAVRVAGDIPSFAEMMNTRALQLGLVSTHFVTPSGLHDDEHYSTAYDMAMLTSYALKNPDFSQICSQKYIRLSFGDPPYDRSLTNTNKLLSRYDGCIGVKTGFTDEAGRCLVSAAQRNGITLICVTLNAPDDWNDHTKLFDYGFGRTENVPVDAGGYFETALAGGFTDVLSLIPERTPVYPRIKGAKQNISWKIVVPPMVYAPVEKGRKIGFMVIYDNGRELDKIPLLSAEAAPFAEGEPQKPSVTDRITDFFKKLLFS